MLVKLLQWLRCAAGAPDHQFIIVSSRRELCVVEGPLQTTYFLPVPDEFGDVILALSEVSVQNVVVPAAGTEECVVPSDGADTSVMAL